MINGACGFTRVVITTLMTTGTALGSDLNVTSFAAYSGQTNIHLQADGNVTFSGGSMSLPPLPPGYSQGKLVVQAGANIVVATGTEIHAGTNWNVSFAASNSVIVNQSSGVSTIGGDITIIGANIQQGGMLQADSVQGTNYLIERIASDGIGLGANSGIAARGDPISAGGSPGGFVILDAGPNGTYVDAAGSTISVTGQSGSQSGGLSFEVPAGAGSGDSYFRIISE
ncbi:MAG: hypothetical protein ABSE48_01070 [Verrucomicrobiota bacterium]